MRNNLKIYNINLLSKNSITKDLPLPYAYIAILIYTLLLMKNRLIQCLSVILQVWLKILFLLLSYNEM